MGIQSNCLKVFEEYVNNFAGCVSVSLICFIGDVTFPMGGIKVIKRDRQRDCVTKQKSKLCKFHLVVYKLGRVDSLVKS